MMEPDAIEDQIIRRPGRKKRERVKDPRRAQMVTPIMRRPTDPVELEKWLSWRRKGAEAAKAVGHRRGIPDGVSRADAAAARAKAAEEAKQILERMRDQGLLDENQAAEEMLEFAVGVVRAKIDPLRERLKAADLVLTYTKAKPVQKQEVKINAAEEWLGKLLETDAQAI